MRNYKQPTLAQRYQIEILKKAENSETNNRVVRRIGTNRMSRVEMKGYRPSGSDKSG
jgi:hypothetical protein